jgi:hypothetical protein
VSEADRPGDGGPVPARDLLRHLQEPASAGDPEGAADAPPDGDRGTTSAVPTSLTFEMDGDAWILRPAGAGVYGTGRRGAARLLAVHFFRASDPGRPVREALVPAGEFGTWGDQALVELFERATPIELERDE